MTTDMKHREKLLAIAAAGYSNPAYVLAAIEHEEAFVTIGGEVIMSGVSEDIVTYDDLVNMAKTLEARQYEVPEPMRALETIERIPDPLGGIYRVNHTGGKHRGPKGGTAKRIDKRRKANKAARKAKQHAR